MTPGSFTDGPEKVKIKGQEAVEFGQQIHLSCSAESVPDCTYTWTLNGTDEIGTGASFIKENSTYEDSGIYTCTAWNSITKETNKTDLELSVKASGSSGEEGGLSIGAIVGIAVSAFVVAVGIGISVFVLKKKGFYSGGTIERGLVHFVSCMVIKSQPYSITMCFL
ncbi:hypothetical protein ACEWY4_019738 [Coilia grayii]|uniref:Ig-like domain-containing protein n=1 Tax=Coilia grayii TaxID=363190 RepID=A0ABD1JCA1_9TELE